MLAEQSYESVKPARSTRRILITTVAAGLALYLVVCGALFALQRSLIYYPQPRLNTEGSVLMTLAVGAAKVHVSTYPHAGPAALIYFGGNAEDVSQDVSDLSIASPGSAIYALHYPGYGGSSGTPTQQAIFADSLALFDRVKADHPDVVIVGRSLGSGVAVWIASQRPITRLVLITPFDSLGDAAAPQYPFLPVRWLLRDRFESWRYAPEVTAPTRIIVAGQDELVPRSSSDRLRTRFREGLVSYLVMPGFGHNTIQDSPGYWALLSKE
ncbi:MAG: lysophospholipase [Acidobacteriota bacterium]|nr:lysophospholipase [Acidobacteriota bacterium]